MELSYNINPLGDNALLIQFENKIDETLNKQVLFLFSQLKSSSLPFIDIIPAYSSLAVYYEVQRLHSKEQTAFENAKALIEPFLTKAFEERSSLRRIRVPVCYSPSFAFDLKELAEQKNVPEEEIVRWHTSKIYRVYMIGFLPGFAYMGTVCQELATTRKMTPRTKVPQGSVGIAGEQTGIYPFNSPGGWNIIGRTPIKVFDITKEEAVIFQPGDEVAFYSITEDEFENYKGGHS